MARKRPCQVCRRWFRPDPRVGERQRSCTSEVCQKERRARTQASWREAHPDYFIARRIEERAAAGRDVEPLRVPAPLDRLPWDIAQDQFKVQGADFIAIFGRLLIGSAQDAMAAEVGVNKGQIRQHGRRARKDQMPAAAMSKPP